MPNGDRANGYITLHVEEAFKYEATFGSVRRSLADLELCSRIIAAKKESQSEEQFGHTIQLMKEVRKAFKKDAKANVWRRIKGTSIGSDLARYMRVVAKLIHDNHE